MNFSRENVADLLWSTLGKLEAELDPADPELRYLRSAILRSIAELDEQHLTAA